MQHQVLLLKLHLTYPLEQAKHVVGTVIKHTKRSAKPCMHGTHSIGFLIVTEETSAQYIERMRPALETLTCLGSYWCYPAPQADDVVSQNGWADPFNHWLRSAWVEARERSKPQNVRRLQRR